MKRRIILLSVVVVILLSMQAGLIGFRRGGSGGSLQTVADDYPIVGGLKTTLGRLFDTSFSLDRDIYDPIGDWSGDDDIQVAAQTSRSLEVRTSGRPVRVFRLRNDDDVAVAVDWEPRADPDAAWWDLTAKTFPNQHFELKPESRRTLVVMKGGGTVSFVSKDAKQDATVEFPSGD